MNLKVGTKVRQRKDSPFYFQSHELTGKITEINDGGWYMVLWSNRHEGGYRQDHLELVDYCNYGQLMLIKKERWN